MKNQTSKILICLLALACAGNVHARGAHAHAKAATHAAAPAASVKAPAAPKAPAPALSFGERMAKARAAIQSRRLTK